MAEQYILFVVLNDLKHYKNIKKKLIDLKYNRFTVVDTIGSTGDIDMLHYTKMLSNTLSETDDTKYNKMVFLVLENEAEVEKVMDALEETISLDPMKPGKGIMFTVPIYTSHGVRF